MSELQVTSLESTTKLTTNGSITAGQTTINSVGIALQGSNGIINTTAVKVTSASGDKIISSYIQTPYITVNGEDVSVLLTETVNTQIFSSNGSWVKPSWANTGNELVKVDLWGGGGAGNTSSPIKAGGNWGGILNYQEFNSPGSSTWNNPYANSLANSSLSGLEQVLVMAWGGGGGGASNNTHRAGGGGGACAIGQYTLSTLGSTVTVNVGSGGAASRTTTTALVAGGDGGTSAFGSLLAYGGGGGPSNLTGARGEVRVWVIGPAPN